MYNTAGITIFVMRHYSCAFHLVKAYKVDLWWALLFTCYSNFKKDNSVMLFTDTFLLLRISKLRWGRQLCRRSIEVWGIFENFYGGTL